MNYTDVLNALKNASLFDLYRLSVAIDHEMENPERIHQVRQSFKEDDSISYFDRNTNSLIEAIVLQKNPKNVLVKNVKDQKIWSIQYCMLNIARTNVDIHSDKLSKNNLKIGDCVGFNHDGREIAGIVIRLNHKTVSLITKDRRRWRVSYKLLYKVIDADIVNMFDTKQIAQWAKEELTLQE
jgi:hypothetical protein